MRRQTLVSFIRLDSDLRLSVRRNDLSRLERRADG